MEEENGGKIVTICVGDLVKVLDGSNIKDYSGQWSSKRL